MFQLQIFFNTRVNLIHLILEFINTGICTRFNYLTCVFKSLTSVQSVLTTAIPFTEVSIDCHFCRVFLSAAETPRKLPGPCDASPATVPVLRS